MLLYYTCNELSFNVFFYYYIGHSYTSIVSTSLSMVTMVTSLPLLSSTTKEIQTTSDTLLSLFETSTPIISTTIPIITPSIVSSIVYTTMSWVPDHSPSPVLLSSSTSEHAIDTTGIPGMIRMDLSLRVFWCVVWFC